MSRPQLDRQVLRDLVREVLRELLPVADATPRPSSASSAAAAARTPNCPAASAVDGRKGSRSPVPAQAPAGTAYAPAAVPEARVEEVSIADDGQLAAFVADLMRRFEEPQAREALRSGRHRFRLRTAPSASETARDERPATQALVPDGGPVTPESAAERIERGAVTESVITRVAKAGGVLVLGRRAVLTPLARDRARALGVRIERED
ncbi:hypothetical protein ABZV31_36710 [Streptomyces sp. NPDC005202]|uniref:hypothetical protein n=1 Tax=Streptomyces sp. NPDC005202 TaxID=3157021 RepID=UPI0033BA409B